jgi:hypothetical protein
MSPATSRSCRQRTLTDEEEREEPEWTPEVRDVAPELEAGFEHSTYPPEPVKFNTVERQLTDLDRETLRLYVAGVTAPGAWRNTEIGDQ